MVYYSLEGVINMPDWIIVLVVALINVIGVYWSAKAANNRAERSEYINAVSASRREWLEKVRNNFIQYNRMVQDESTKTEEFTLNHIEMGLLLNPSERYNSLLSLLYGVYKAKRQGVRDCELQEQGDESFFISDKEIVQFKELFRHDALSSRENCYTSIQLVQQIILKREWEIIKQEVKDGGNIDVETENEKTKDAVEAIDKTCDIPKILNDIGK